MGQHILGRDRFAIFYFTSVKLVEPVKEPTDELTTLVQVAAGADR